MGSEMCIRDSSYDAVCDYELPDVRALCLAEDACQVESASNNKQHIGTLLVEDKTDLKGQDPVEKEMNPVDPC